MVRLPTRIRDSLQFAVQPALQRARVLSGRDGPAHFSRHYDICVSGLVPVPAARSLEAQNLNRMRQVLGGEAGVVNTGVNLLLDPIESAAQWI